MRRPPRVPAAAKIVRKCQDLPGQELFGYIDDQGQPRDVGSGDVNDYLFRITGDRFTAKDFRTWGGTVIAAAALHGFGPPMHAPKHAPDAQPSGRGPKGGSGNGRGGRGGGSGAGGVGGTEGVGGEGGRGQATQVRAETPIGARELKRREVAAVRAAAAALCNTPATSRKYYVHPRLIEAYARGILTEAFGAPPPTPRALRPEERAVLSLLRRLAARPPAAVPVVTTNGSAGNGRRRRNLAA